MIPLIPRPRAGLCFLRLALPGNPIPSPSRHASALPCPWGTFGFCQAAGLNLLFLTLAVGDGGEAGGRGGGGWVRPGLSNPGGFVLYPVLKQRELCGVQMGKGKGKWKAMCRGSECFLDPEDGRTLVSAMLFNEKLTSLSPELHQDRKLKSK